MFRLPARWLKKIQKAVAETWTFEAHAPGSETGVKQMELESSAAADPAIDLDLRYKFDFSDPAVRADPFPYYKALLATAPIIAQRQVPWAIVSRYDDVVKVLRDHQGYSSVNPLMP